MVKAKTRASTKKAAAAQVVKVPPKALPVTLLSGFLGSGKTTLLQHILRSEHGLRIAVIVNDIGAINVDASLIKQTHHLTRTEEKVVALQNGCICCTLRGDLLEELVRLAELQSFDYIIIESSGISEPEQVAETFDARLAETMNEMGEGPEGLDEAMMKVLEQLKQAGGLEKFARLDTTVTVIDAFTIYHDFETTDLLSSRRDDVVPEDERTVSDLLVDQIEFADVIILNKTDLVSPSTLESMLTLIRKLNHRAKIITSKYSKIDVKEIVNTGMFNLERAQTGYGWLQDLHEMTLREVNGRKAIAPKPETEEYNVRNFVYTRRRPFHPLRLFQLLHDKFILQLEHGDDEEDDDEAMDEDEEEEEDEDDEMADADAHSSDASPDGSATSGDPVEYPEVPENDVVLANKKAHPLFARLFRSKGEFHLATRHHRAGEWSQAGAMLTLSGGRPWFCTIPSSEYVTGNAEIDALVEHDIAAGGEWGDRRQEIVFIGEALNIKGIEAVLDECLLTDKEMSVWESIMRDKGLTVEGKMDALADAFDDGFPEWPEEEEEGHEGHGHGPGEHGLKRPTHRITKDGVVR
ncbi:cobW domain-containing protein [Pseudovirgaria hyperparasitica]|uniref:CobW domain-containing protein n=1 Tax=Pseudovirgaria hyperparasitica TaxID=470096 RepID=A0A6A6WHM9_9PEZI|nr:cobW domain-containing protein [Pseudovirgaria hyperparasitica]KAF2762298.1 cobW domain-containing protein [Pseudovirgaria hyperparasitica]